MLFLLRTAVPSARQCSARLIGFAKRSGFRLASLALRLRTAVPSARWCPARLIGFAKRSDFRLASLALRLRTAVPSARWCSARLIGFAKRSGFRLASLALRWAGSLTALLTSQLRTAVPSARWTDGQPCRSELHFFHPSEKLRRDVGIGQVFRQRIKEANLFNLEGRQCAELFDLGGKSTAAAAFQPHPIIKQRR